MAAPTFIAWNQDTSALTVAPTSVTTGTAKKTMLQIVASTAPSLRILEWGYSFDTVPTAFVQVELVETGTIAATVTSLGSGVRNYSNQTGNASTISIGTGASGFTASAEGTITTSRLLAYQQEWGSQFKQQFPLGREPEIGGSRVLRIRATTTVAVNMTCYVVWEE